jgi:CBS domain-containing protein
MALTPGPSGKEQKIKCPSCGFENILGLDRCEQCLHTLMQTGLPKPKKNDKIQSAMMNDPVSVLLTEKHLLVCSPTDTMQKVVRAFQKENKSCVLVYDHKHLVGILSGRDLLLRVAGKYKDLSKVKVKDVMTPRPEWVKEDDPIAFMVNKMAMGVCRNVPVLAADGTPYSIVVIHDVLSYLSTKRKSSV